MTRRMKPVHTWEKSKAMMLGADCSHCPYYNEPGPVLDGPVLERFQDVELIVVGEAPGSEEVRPGGAFRPLIGQSGRLLNAALEQTAWKRETTYCTNALLCKPSGKAGEGLSDDALRCCRPRLVNELAQVHKYNPEAKLVGMGGTALAALLGHPPEEGIKATRGRWLLSEAGPEGPLWFLASYHPAFILRNPAQCKDMLDDLTKAHQEPIINTWEPTYEVVQQVEDLIYPKAGEVIAADLETSQVKYREDVILCLALCYSSQPDHVYIVPGSLMYDTRDSDVWWQFWSRPDVEFVGHNFKFDQKFMMYQLGWKPRCDFDTMLAHYCLEERKGTHDLKSLIQFNFDVPNYEHQMIKPHLHGANPDYSLVPKDVLYKYAAMDVAYTLKLKVLLEQQLREQGLYDTPFRSIIMPLSETAVQVELNGMYIDMGRVNAAYTYFDEALKSLYATIQYNVQDLLPELFLPAADPRPDRGVEPDNAQISRPGTVETGVDTGTTEPPDAAGVGEAARQEPDFGQNREKVGSGPE